MKRWSICTDSDGKDVIESIDTRATEAFHLEIYCQSRNARRLVGIYSDRAEADAAADWFGRKGDLRAEVSGPHALAAGGAS